MPPRRPAIPAELKSAVLVEAGHRCGIPTCRATTTEIAHIVPWAEVKCHEFANLIALCPNCHTRYDQKKEISRKEMRMYKAKLGEQSKLEQALKQAVAKHELLAGTVEQLQAQMAALAARLNSDSQAHNPAAEQARSALADGNLAPTVDYLRKIEQTEAAQGATSLARAAEAARERAAISTTADALLALQKACEYEPENVVNWDLLGDMQMQAGNLTQAEIAYRRMLQLTEALSPKGPDEQHDLSVSYGKIGIIQQDQGDLPGALTTFQRAQAIDLKLTQLDAANSEWQRTLSISHERIGDVLQAQGDFSRARTSFRKCLSIRKKLTRLDPDNSQWQSDLSVSYERIGDIQKAQGDLPGALVSFRNSLTIAEKLARLDPANSEWQHSLWVSYNKIGETQQHQGELQDATEHYRNGLTIAEKFAHFDPENSMWQSDLSTSHSNIGDIQQAQGDLTGALVSFSNSLTIAEKLARLDSTNGAWQRGLSISYSKIGTVQQTLGDFPGALTSLRNSLTIREKLACLDPANVQWQTDVVISCVKMSTVSTGVEQRGYLQRGLDVLLRLDKEKRLTPELKNDWIPMFQVLLKQP